MGLSYQGLIELLDKSSSTDGQVIFADPREQVVRFSEIWKMAHQAGFIMGQDHREGTTVAGILRPNLACIVTLFGAWLAGVRFASLPDRARGMTEAEHAEQIDSILELVGGEFVYESYPGEIGNLSRGVLAPYQGILDKIGESTQMTSGGNAGILIQFTSGSTSSPKGVVIGMDEIGWNVSSMSEAFCFRPGDTSSSWLPLSHDMGLIGTFLLPCVSMTASMGGISKVWLITPESFVRDPLGWLRVDQGASASFSMIPNFALDLIARKLKNATGLNLSNFRNLIVSAETVRASTLGKFSYLAREFGFNELAFQPAYGMAETTLGATTVRGDELWSSVVLEREAYSEGKLNVVSKHAGTQDSHLNLTGEFLASFEEVVCLGRPFPGFEMKIDTQASDDLGRVSLKSGSIAQELVGTKSLELQDGFYQTEDLGFCVDNELYFAGRCDDWMVIRGRNLDARAIELASSRSPAVRDGNCVVVPDESGTYAVVAEPAVTVASSEPISRDQIDEIINYALGVSGITPSRIVIVDRGSLPKTPSGKIQRRKVSVMLDNLEGKIAQFWTKEK